MQVDVEQLAAMAKEPVVVQREDDWDSSSFQLVEDRGRQAGQMVNVRDVRPNAVDEIRRELGDNRVVVRLLE